MQCKTWKTRNLASGKKTIRGEITRISMHKHSFTRTHCSTCRASSTLDLRGSVCTVTVPALLNWRWTRMDPFRLRLWIHPLSPVYSPLPTTARTVQTGAEHDGQTHNVLKCWILFVLMDSVLTTNKTFQLNTWRLLQSTIRIMETFWEGLSLHKWFFKLISRMTDLFSIQHFTARWALK